MGQFMSTPITPTCDPTFSRQECHVHNIQLRISISENWPIFRLLHFHNVFFYVFLFYSSSFVYFSAISKELGNSKNTLFISMIRSFHNTFLCTFLFLCLLLNDTIYYFFFSQCPLSCFLFYLLFYHCLFS